MPQKMLFLKLIIAKLIMISQGKPSLSMSKLNKMTSTLSKDWSALASTQSDLSLLKEVWVLC